MTHIKLVQLQKTLFLALTLLGASCNLSLVGGSPKAQAHSAIPEVSTATGTHLSSSRLSMSGEAAVQPLPSLSSLNLAPQQGQHPSAATQTPPWKLAENEPDLGGGAPQGGTRRAGGTRGDCPAVNLPLTALVPIVQTNSAKSQNPILSLSTSESVSSLTGTEHPTFWFYNPYSGKYPVEFVLVDDKGNEVYTTSLTVSTTKSGIVGFKLPSAAPGLKVNKWYRWYLSIYCNQDNPPSVDGWVRRVVVNSSLKSQIEQATPQESVALYNKANLWQDAITTLAELRRQKPNDATLRQEWATLLRSIGLEAIAPEPITSMLSPKK